MAENAGYDHPCSLEFRKAGGSFVCLFLTFQRKVDLVPHSETQDSLWEWGSNQGVGNSENEYCVRKVRVPEGLNPWGNCAR